MVTVAPGCKLFQGQRKATTTEHCPEASFEERHVVAPRTHQEGKFIPKLHSAQKTSLETHCGCTFGCGWMDVSGIMDDYSAPVVGGVMVKIR